MKLVVGSGPLQGMDRVDIFCRIVYKLVVGLSHDKFGLLQGTNKANSFVISCMKLVVGLSHAAPTGSLQGMNK